MRLPVGGTSSPVGVVSGPVFVPLKRISAVPTSPFSKRLTTSNRMSGNARKNVAMSSRIALLPLSGSGYIGSCATQSSAYVAAAASASWRLIASLNSFVSSSNRPMLRLPALACARTAGAYTRVATGVCRRATARRRATAAVSGELRAFRRGGLLDPLFQPPAHLAQRALRRVGLDPQHALAVDFGDVARVRAAHDYVRHRGTRHHRWSLVCQHPKCHRLRPRANRNVAGMRRQRRPSTLLGGECGEPVP